MLVMVCNDVKNNTVLSKSISINAINGLFDYLKSLQNKNLKSLLSNNLIDIRFDDNINSVESLKIKVVLDHLCAEKYRFECLIKSSFKLNYGYENLFLNFAFLNTFLYKEKELILIDNYHAVEFKPDGILISSGKEQLRSDLGIIKPLCLSDVRNFVESFLLFIDLIELLLSDNIKNNDLSIKINIPELFSENQFDFVEPVNKNYGQMPGALKRVLANNNGSFVLIKYDNKIKLEENGNGKLYRAVDFSIERNGYIPEALKRVLNDA